MAKPISGLDGIISVANDDLVEVSKRTGLLTYDKKVAKAHPGKTIIRERIEFEDIDWDLAGFSPHEMRR